jgi:hypothetical protein
MPPAIVRRMFRAHQASPARTDFRSFPGRTHWLIGQDGWHEIAQACLDWIESLAARESSHSLGRVSPLDEEVSMQVDQQVPVLPGLRYVAD